MDTKATIVSSMVTRNLGQCTNNTTTTFTIPSDIFRYDSVYIAAIANSYGVGSVAVLIVSGADNIIRINYIVDNSASYFKFIAVSGHPDQFQVQAYNAIGLVRVTKIA